MAKKITYTLEAECANGVSELALEKELNRKINELRGGKEYIFLDGQEYKVGFISWTEATSHRD